MKKSLKIILILFAVIILLAGINFIPLLNKKVPGMKAMEFSGFTVWATEEEREEASAVAARIRTASAQVKALLNHGDFDDIEIILYPDRKDLHRKTIGFAGIFLPDWFIGNNNWATVFITSPANPGPAHTRESITQAAVHEYVHVLTDRKNSKLDHWLKEGFALYLAGQTPSMDSIIWASNLTYEEFCGQNPLKFADVGGYTMAYVLIEYLSEEYGWETILHFLDPGSTYKDVTGETKQHVFAEWISWIGKMYGSRAIS